MRALLLAAGLGTRLRPLTNHLPKCLVPIRGRPLLDYWMETLVNGGVSEILINTHYLAPLVIEFINKSIWAPHVTFVHEEHLLGTGGTVLKNRSFFQNEAFLIAHADNLTIFNVQEFLNCHHSRPIDAEMTMMVFETDNPQSCGIVEIDDSGVVKVFHEKVSSPPGNLANAAVYILEPSVIDLITEFGKEEVDFSTEVIPRLMERIFTYCNSSYHRDIGTIASWTEAHKDFPVMSAAAQNAEVRPDILGSDDGKLSSTLTGGPTLSVLMTNFNHARYLPESLGAILAQSYQPLEIIVIDDASTDDSVEIIEAFATKDSRIRLIRNKCNRGMLANFSHLLELATGDYVYIPAADDKILPGFFEKSMQLLAECPQAGLCFSEWERLDDQTGDIKPIRFGLSDVPIHYTATQFADVMRGKGILFAGVSSIVKRSAMIETGGILSELRWHWDGFSCFLIGLRYGSVHVPEPLALFRYMPSSYSSARLQNQDVEREVLRSMLRLVDSSDYRDILPAIKRTGFLGVYGWEIFKIILSQPKYWGHLSLSFLAFVVPIRAGIALSRWPLLHRTIRQLYIMVRKRHNRQISEGVDAV